LAAGCLEEEVGSYLEEAGGSIDTQCPELRSSCARAAPELAGGWLASWHSHQPGEDPRLLPGANAGRRPLRKTPSVPNCV
jgi:hypothetical protein